MRKRIRRRLSPLPVPPEGFMYGLEKSHEIVPIDEVKRDCCLSMDFFDRLYADSPAYYRNDPSYWWSRKEREKQ